MDNTFDFDNSNSSSKQFEGKAKEELLEAIRLQYLIGVATLLNDFPKNIDYLIELRDTRDAQANTASDKLLGMLFTSTKNPQVLSIPDLDIDKILNAMNNVTE